MLYSQKNKLGYNPSLLMSLNYDWLFFAIFWFIPYSLLAIYLFFWSRNKTVGQIRGEYVLAPLKMMYLSVGLYLTITIILLITGSESFVFIFGAATVASIPASLVLGYFFVGLSFLLYKVLQKFKFVQDREIQI